MVFYSAQLDTCAMEMKVKKTALIYAMLPILFCYQAIALERFEIVTTEELVTMLAQREMGQLDFVLVNTLDEIIFRNSSIPDSVNIPWSRFEETIHRAGNDMNKLLVMY